MKTRGFLCAILFTLLPLSGAASDIASIHADQLPQDKAVTAALKDATELEPYAWYFALPPWKFPIARDEVARRLGADMSVLEAAKKQHPDNLELQLLTGLVGHYGYNVDVRGSHKIAMESFGAAEKLAPGDFRPEWFQSALKCQTKEFLQGAEGMLVIEAGHPWRKLPPAFWVDYIECAEIANMPGHLLRAAAHLEKMHAPVSERQAEIVAAVRDLFVPFNPKKKYKPTEAWEAGDVGSATVFISTLCGVRLLVPSSWQIEVIEYSKGSCVVAFLTQFYQGTVHQRRPSVMLMVQRPKDRETLEQYARRFMTKGTFAPFTPKRCPADTCLAWKGVQPDVYRDDGGSRPRMILFERGEPDFPDVALESPMSLVDMSGNKPQTYRPRKVLARIPGKLYYLVLLDTAGSIEGSALKDYDLFLRNLTVE